MILQKLMVVLIVCCLAGPSFLAETARGAERRASPYALAEIFALALKHCSAMTLRRCG